MENNAIDTVKNLSENDLSKLETISKRVEFNQDNMRKLKIMGAIFDEDVKDMKDNEIISYFVNKAIDSMYKSKEVQDRLLNP